MSLVGLLAIPAFVLIASALGVLGASRRGLVRTKGVRPSIDRWKLPPVGQVMPEEFAASAASGR
ncbi:hypothetical protein POL68_25810 [Stigmatella sp. ncwal1]|uniref:Uncharacterized protein n=1 Tax=Stigmatella ashevillensis TaxID=2995309 RepID=A0ABT5DDZ9_9BACT|nr:hypothetical protein [Stigmatella ashevillena]MDC0711910.1 hypothetical protein [Stigmatella ashevillena]